MNSLPHPNTRGGGNSAPSAAVKALAPRRTIRKEALAHDKGVDGPTARPSQRGGLEREGAKGEDDTAGAGPPAAAATPGSGADELIEAAAASAAAARQKEGGGAPDQEPASAGGGKKYDAQLLADAKFLVQRVDDRSQYLAKAKAHHRKQFLVLRNTYAKFLGGEHESYLIRDAIEMEDSGSKLQVSHRNRNLHVFLCFAYENGLARPCDEDGAICSPFGGDRIMVEPRGLGEACAYGGHLGFWVNPAKSVVFTEAIAEVMGVDIDYERNGHDMLGFSRRDWGTLTENISNQRKTSFGLTPLLENRKGSRNKWVDAFRGKIPLVYAASTSGSRLDK